MTMGWGCCVGKDQETFSWLSGTMVFLVVTDFIVDSCVEGSSAHRITEKEVHILQV